MGKDKIRLVGVDAGGTKTDIVLCDGCGHVLGRLTRGSGNINDVGADACFEMISQAIGELLGDADPRAIFVGASGAISGDGPKFLSKMREFYPRSAVTLENDSANLLAMTREEGEISIALICGTGSIIYVKRGDKLFRIGGWGHLFDKGGSAYDIGRDALCELLAAEEGTAPFGELCKLTLDRIGAESAHSVLSGFYKKDKTAVASLALSVFEADKLGDRAARAIIERNVEAIAARLEDAQKAFGARGEIVCGGGVFGSREFTDMLKKRVLDMGFRLYIPAFPQSLGACIRAAMLATDDLDKKLFTDNFSKTLNDLHKK
jgi:N-acetylglucosamine kinase-like BadF-type ATPase